MNKHIFIIGSKGIPASYGGFETFVEKLAQHKQAPALQYHVACMGKEKKEFLYMGAECFTIKVPDIGPARAIYYDICALRESLRQVRERKLIGADIYVLACRIGPFIGYYKRKMKKLGMTLYVNPDGHEWMRGKWSVPIQRYWKFSERLMVKHADLLICDSENIESYIRMEYAGYRPRTTYIAYGADVQENPNWDKQGEDVSRKLAAKAQAWYEAKGIAPHNYFLAVGRFVPENNYETMIREFMASSTTKDFVFVANVEQNKFYQILLDRTGFDKDARIKFVGTVYDEALLSSIRKNAFAYLHGHEVGGTNPSLLEALSSTDLNLLLDVGFNREVGRQGALYWRKESGSLKKLLEQAEAMPQEDIAKLGEQAKTRIRDAYSWPQIVYAYEALFLGKVTEG